MSLFGIGVISLGNFFLDRCVVVFFFYGLVMWKKIRLWYINFCFLVDLENGYLYVVFVIFVLVGNGLLYLFIFLKK